MESRSPLSIIGHNFIKGKCKIRNHHPITRRNKIRQPALLTQKNIEMASLERLNDSKKINLGNLSGPILTVFTNPKKKLLAALCGKAKVISRIGRPRLNRDLQLGRKKTGRKFKKRRILSSRHSTHFILLMLRNG